MKKHATKLILCSLTISLAAFVGCNQQREPVGGLSLPVTRSTAVERANNVGEEGRTSVGPAKLDIKFSAAELENISTKCKTDADCTLMPKLGCFGCMTKDGEGGHISLSKESAEAITKSRADKCTEAAKNFKPPMEDPKNPDPSCQHNKAVCQAGECVLGDFSPAELEAMKKEFEKQMAEKGKGEKPNMPQKGGRPVAGR
jgi:hypothetical protein